MCALRLGSVAALGSGGVSGGEVGCHWESIPLHCGLTDAQRMHKLFCCRKWNGPDI